MYKKLFKIFITKNKSIFFLIIISLSISIFGYIFSDLLSKNFLNTIQEDSRDNMGGDFVIDIGNSNQEVFDDFIKDFPYINDIEISKNFSFYSSIETNDIIPINLIFIDKNFPLYGKFEYEIKNKDAKLILSENFYQSINFSSSINLLANKYETYGVYKELPSSVGNFLSIENMFLYMENYEDIITNEQNSLIEKKYYIKLKNPLLFDDIKKYLENKNSQNQSIRINNYKDGGERFSDIIENLIKYINYIILFSFILTSVIIFLSISSFFIKERKNISILRILGMKNSGLKQFYFILFFIVFIISFILASFLSFIGFFILKNIGLTKDFDIFLVSFLKGIIISILIIGFSIFIPLIKFLKNDALSGLKENFYSISSKKEIIVNGFFFFILIIILSLFLGYLLLNSILNAIVLIAFISIFYLLSYKLLNYIYNKAKKIKKKYFIIYDTIRSTIKPGNLSLLLNIIFFIIFFIGLFILILFGNFYNRLKLNLDTDKNFFVINIDQDSYEKIDNNYKNDAYSIIKGRIKSINGQNLDDFLKGNNSMRFTREFNITDNNLSNEKILTGKKLEEGGVSLDYNFAKDLGIWVGDEIVFQIYGIEKNLKIVNIRESIDYSINPFFYFQVDNKEFKEFPKQFFLSTFVDEEDKQEFKKYFYDLSNGTVNFLEVDKILLELKDISQKVLIVIQSLFFYIVIFCILSIIVIGLFFNQLKIQNNKLYHLLGATKKQIKLKNFLEYTYLSSIMFVISIILASLISFYILNKNNFIDFDLLIYLKSIIYLSIFYIILLLVNFKIN